MFGGNGLRQSGVAESDLKYVLGYTSTVKQELKQERIISIAKLNITDPSVRFLPTEELGTDRRRELFGILWPFLHDSCYPQTKNQTTQLSMTLRFGSKAWR